MDRILRKITDWDWSKYKNTIEKIFGYEVNHDIIYELGNVSYYTKKFSSDNTLLMFIAGDGFERIESSHRGGEQYMSSFMEIINRNPEIINAKNKEGHTALMFAILSSTFETGTEKAKLLIEHGSEVSDAKKLIEGFLLPLFTETALKKYTDVVERLQTILGYMKKRNKARQLKFSPKAKTKILKNVLGNMRTLPPSNYKGMRGIKRDEHGEIVLDEDYDPVLGSKEREIEEEEESEEKTIYKDYEYQKYPYRHDDEEEEDDYMGAPLAIKNTTEGNSKIMKKIPTYGLQKRENSAYNKVQANKIWNEIATRALSDD